jgi:ABC-2 type transport system permease protein
MSFPLLKQTFKSNFAVWGLVTLVMNVILAQLIMMKQTQALVGPMYFGMLASTMVALFVVISGNKLLAGQVDQGSMAYILTAPIRRTTVAITQLVYMVGSLAVTYGAMAGVSVIANNIADAGFKTQTLINLNFGAFMVALAFAGIMFAASGIFNLSKYAFGTGGLLVILFILLAIVGSFADYGVAGLEDVQHLTIVSLFDYKNILVAGSKWLPKLAALGGIAAVTFGVGTTAFAKKDLPL